MTGSPIVGSPAPSLLVPMILVMGSAASIMSTDLYVPSLPDLVSYFSTTAERVQITMWANLIAYAGGYLIYGPLADRYGRRPVLIGGMILFCLTSFACAFAPSIDFLILARILQGNAASAQAVIATMMIRDLYPGNSGVRIFAIYGMALAITPAVAPIIGGYVHVWLGWQANFLLLTAIITVITATIFRHISETAENRSQRLRPLSILRSYLKLSFEPGFMGYALCSGFVTAGLFGFITSAPFVIITVYRTPVQHYGYYQAAAVVAFFLGNLVASRAGRRLGVESLLRLGLLCCFLGGIIALGTARLDLASPEVMLIGICVFLFGMALNYATVPMRAMDATGASRGVSAALLGAFQMGGGALGAATTSLLHENSPWPLAATLCGAAVLAPAVYLLLRPWRFLPSEG